MSEDKNTEVEQAAIEPEAIEDADELAAVEPAGTDIDLAAGDEEDEDSEDSLTFSNGVIEKIVALAMRDVPGVVGMKGSWFNRVQDAFGASVYEETPEVVHNVLVGAPETADIVNEQQLYGRQLAYTLAIPKGDEHDWTNVTVEFFGRKFRTYGAVTEGIEALIPLSWNRKVKVERYE